MGPLAALLFSLAAVGDGPITGIGSLTPDGGSWIAALSEDGGTAVGWTRVGANFTAVRWTPATGLERVQPAAWNGESFCADVSADGKVVAGFGDDGVGGFWGFVWNADSGFATPLGSMPGGTFSTTRAVCDDGSLVMGLASDALGTLSHVAWIPGTDTPILVQSSIPGVVIDPRALRRVGPSELAWVGTAWDAQSQFQVPVRFGPAQAIERVPDAPGPFSKAFASDASRDGVVVGHQQLLGARTRAYVSSPSSGLQLLETPLGWSSVAMAISADGRRIVGYLHQDNSQRPTLWDLQPSGAYAARDPVLLIGPPAAIEWNLFAVVDVSADRATIAGIGYELRSGAIRGFVASVPPE
jgi:uncharacterized membrane protein